MSNLRAAPRVALVHDWLTGMRGGERCLETFAELLPDAPILTLFHEPGKVSPAIERHAILASPLSHSRYLRKRYRRLLPLFPWAARRLPARDFDRVISLSHCAAKGVAARADARHICYCFTPARYLWDQSEIYLDPERAPLYVRAGARVFLPALRRWDRATAAGVHRFVAISRWVARRIERVYGRSAEVIYPPVATARFSPAPPAEIGDHFLLVTALAPYKGVDLAIDTFRRWGRRLVIVGSGEDKKRLRRLGAGCANIEFRGRLGDAEVAHEYAHCRAFLLPCEEDFGITPLEAMASGRPAVALGRGGALETVRPLGGSEPFTGIHFDAPEPDSLIAALETLERHLDRFDPLAARRHAVQFDTAVFRRRIAALLREEGVELDGDAAPAGAGAAPVVATEEARA